LKYAGVVLRHFGPRPVTSSLRLPLPTSTDPPVPSLGLSRLLARRTLGFVVRRASAVCCCLPPASAGVVAFRSASAAAAAVAIAIASAVYTSGPPFAKNVVAASCAVAVTSSDSGTGQVCAQCVCHEKAQFGWIRGGRLHANGSLRRRSPALDCT
jgi:hypothetical protein